MLLGKPTNYGTGIEIQGDFKDFRSLSETIKFCLKTLNYQQGETLIYRFDRAIFHALISKNNNVTMSDFDGNTVTYKTFRYHWHTFIVVTTLIRRHLGYTDSENLVHISNVNMLESIGKNAMKTYDSELGTDLSRWLINGFLIDKMPELEVLCNQFEYDLMKHKGGKSRFRFLVEHMYLFSFFHSTERKEYLKHIQEEADKRNVSIEHLELFYNFDSINFRW